MRRVASLSDGGVRTSGAPMKIRRSIAVLAAVTLGLLVLAPGASAGNTRNEHFILLTNDPSDNSKLIVIATGPIHARGTDQQINPVSKDKFVFPKGTITVLHQAKHSNNTFDSTTCYGTFTETGTYQVTGGTRAYDDARGHGTYNLNASFVGCNQSAPPLLVQVRLDASGPLTLGH
jgi:hypothetical protein